MPKKSDSHGAGREAHNPHNQSSSGQDRPANQDQPQGHQGGNSGAHQEGQGGLSGYRRQIRDNKMNEANKKGGCLPKLFMLTLPFIAAGAYLVLRS